VLSGHTGEIYAVAFDGLRIVAGSADSTIRVWSASTGCVLLPSWDHILTPSECIALLQGHTSLVGQLQLTDDILTTGGSDGRIIVFNLATMNCLAHDNSVTCLQFDQRFILSGGNDGRAKVWDIQTGRFLRELTRPCESVWRVTFKDDRAVVLCQRNGGTALEIISFRPEDEKRKSIGEGDERNRSV
jgi:F-box and WD-40 domain protein CDC4